jgi:hypothetical protein
VVGIPSEGAAGVSAPSEAKERAVSANVSRGNVIAAHAADEAGVWQAQKAENGPAGGGARLVLGRAHGAFVDLLFPRADDPVRDLPDHLLQEHPHMATRAEITGGDVLHALRVGR